MLFSYSVEARKMCSILFINEIKWILILKCKSLHIQILKCFNGKMTNLDIKLFVIVNNMES